MSPLTGAAAWSYQPAEARTAAWSRYPRVPRPGPPVPPVPSALVGRAVLSWLAPTLPRNRYKILPAQLLGGENGTKLSLHVEKAPNRAISREQGEFCTAHTVRGGVLGEFCTEAARRGSCWARFVSPWHLPCVQLPGFLHPPAPQPGPRPLQHARHWWRWGFCSIRSWLSACRRRVAPLMLQFSPIGGGAAAVRGGAVAKVQTLWVKTVK